MNDTLGPQHDMDQLAALEGRLLAHRRLLARMVALMPPRSRRDLLDWLDQHEVLHDGQEDPGAVPTEGLAASMGATDEFRLLAEIAAAAPEQDDDGVPA